ncbi:MAG: hypothetical protein R3C49_01735 [Planctomycetaceae bacterium]
MRPLSDAEVEAIEHVSEAVAQSSSETVSVDEAELRIVHALSDAFARTTVSRAAQLLQLHGVASCLAVVSIGLRMVISDPALLIAAPIALLLSPIAGPWILATAFMSGGPLETLFAIWFSVGYTLCVMPAWFIARDLRWREFTTPVYIVFIALAVVGVPSIVDWLGSSG